MTNRLQKLLSRFESNPYGLIELYNRYYIQAEGIIYTFEKRKGMYWEPIFNMNTMEAILK